MQQPFIGIQVGAISFVDEGTAPVLDVFQEKAKVNALLVATHAFGYGTAGRVADGRFPDHGGQEPDHLVGGSFVTTHKQYYAGTPLTEFRAPDPLYEGLDALEMVIPEAQKRRMQVISWINENPYAGIVAKVPNLAKLLQIDVYGRKMPEPCFHNPEYKNWWFSMVEDHVKSYPIDGVMFGPERNGPLANVFGGKMAVGSVINPRVIPACFCDYCQRRGRDKGINPERAREGYLKLMDYAARASGGEEFVDGYLVEFLRLFLRYPEVLAWDTLWFEGLHNMYREIYGLVKAIDPKRHVGWHIVHTNSWSPLYRAQTDYSEMRRYSDWLKPVVYNNCAGIRFKQRFVDTRGATIFRDVPKELLTEFMYKVLNLEEAPYSELGPKGWSDDYVYRETRRCVRGVKDEIPVYPGIDVDIPIDPGNKPTEPEDVKAAIKAAFKGGAKGVILSRKYSEMQMKNVRAAGEALAELGVC